MKPIHPGEFLREEFLVPLGISPTAFAKLCGVPRMRVWRITNEKLGVSGEMALRLGRVLKTTPEFWMNLQKKYELDAAQKKIGAVVMRLKQCEAIE